MCKNTIYYENRICKKKVKFGKKSVFIIAKFLSPVGAALNSRGRKPTEVITPYPL